MAFRIYKIGSCYDGVRYSVLLLIMIFTTSKGHCFGLEIHLRRSSASRIAEGKLYLYNSSFRMLS